MQALQELLANRVLISGLEQPLSDQEKLKELVGHTPLQVCMGALLGIATGILCNLGA